MLRGRLLPVLANLVNSNVVRAVRRGGNVNNGANAGPRYVNANNAPSNGNWNYGGGLTLIRSIPSISRHLLLHIAFPWFPQGIEIPSDWNRLGRFILEESKGMKR